MLQCNMHSMLGRVYECTFPQGLVTQVGQLLAVHCSVSGGLLVLSQTAAATVTSTPLTSSR